MGEIGKVLANLEFKTPAGIPDRIVVVIEKYKLKAAKRRLAVYSIVSLAAGGAIGVAAANAVAILRQSGTLEMLSLAFSDIQAVSANFGDYFYSVAGSFPVMQAVYFLGAVLAFVVVVRGVAKNVDTVGKLRRYASHRVL